MIPVGYIDLAGLAEGAVLADSWEVDSLVDCIRQASGKSADWCREASEFAIRKYEENCEPEMVGRNLKQMFADTARKMALAEKPEAEVGR